MTADSTRERAEMVKASPMELLNDVAVVVKYLRGDSSVSKLMFKMAVQELVETGMGWWIGLSTEPMKANLVFPHADSYSDSTGRAVAADFLEYHTKGVNTRIASDSDNWRMIPWSVILPVLFDLAKSMIMGAFA